MNQQELIKVYKQLDTLEQTKDVLNLKAQIRETLYHSIRTFEIITV